MFIHAPKEGLISLRLCGQHMDLEEPTPLWDRVYFGVYVAWIQATLEHRAREHRLSRISDFSRYYQTITGWEKSHADTVASSCDKKHKRTNAWKIMRIGKQKNRATVQKVSTPCLDDHPIQKKKRGKQLENGQTFVHKSSSNAYIQQASAGLALYVLWITWQEQSPNGIKLVTNARSLRVLTSISQGVRI